MTAPVPESPESPESPEPWFDFSIPRSLLDNIRSLDLTHGVPVLPARVLSHLQQLQSEFSRQAAQQAHFELLILSVNLRHGPDRAGAIISDALGRAHEASNNRPEALALAIEYLEPYGSPSPIIRQEETPWPTSQTPPSQ
jgi:hypothetical protein